MSMLPAPIRAIYAPAQRDISEIRSFLDPLPHLDQHRPEPQHLHQASLRPPPSLADPLRDLRLAAPER